jgi:hypothetical protein
VIKSDRVVDIDLGDGTTKRSVTAGTHRAAMVLRALGIEKIEPPPRHAQVKPDQVRSQTWRMAQTTRSARLADLSSSDPIRWRPRAEREQKHDPGGRDDSRVER